jgi:predicted acetyltransferase
MNRDMERRSPHEHPTLETFLTDLGLQKYLKLFEDALIDFNLLLPLTEEELKDLGIVM